MMDFEVSLPVVSTEQSPPRLLSSREIASASSAAEDAGYRALMTAETNIDPFLPLVTAAEATSRIEIGTSVAIALARSPMTLAYTAHQLQASTGGRFVLGLGTQIKPHITRRFSMPWDSPVKRMATHIDALRMIWQSWRDGQTRTMNNDFFTIDLRSANFYAPAHDYADPPIMLAAVGPSMTRLAARKADGIITHPFADARYLSEVTVPIIEAGLSSAGRSPQEFRVSATVLTAVGETPEELGAAVASLRRRIAFYGSTPAYATILEHHGWGQLARQLHERSTTSDPDRWARMADLVPDDVVETIGIVGGHDDVRREAVRRYSQFADRLRGDGLAPTAP